jgi:hypothetical protein
MKKRFKGSPLLECRNDVQLTALLGRRNVTSKFGPPLRLQLWLVFCRYWVRKWSRKYYALLWSWLLCYRCELGALSALTALCVPDRHVGQHLPTFTDIILYCRFVTGK